MTAATRTRSRRLTVRQQAALDRLVWLSEGTYESRGGWVPLSVASNRCVGARGALAQLVAKGLVETRTARGPLGNDRPVYRPRAEA